LNDDIELLAVYLVKEKTPKRLHNVLEQIWDVFEQCVELTETSKVIYTLQETVQKLVTKIETNTKEQNTQELGSGRYSYTAVARRDTPVYTEQSCTEQSHIEPEKAVSV
jgi:Zn-dependent M32 family carboxypeptidase